MMIDHIDYLVLLLSADWFKAHWDVVGIRLSDDSMKNSMQAGCRDIVKQILAGAETYYSVSFSEERRRLTRSMVTSLLERLNASREVEATVAEWASMNHE